MLVDQNLKFPIWLSWPKEISAARKTLTLYNFWKLQCHLKIRGLLCKDCGTGQPKGFESRGTCTCTCTCIFMLFFQDTGTSEIWTFERTGRTHLERWAEDVSSWKPQHGALPGRGWDPTEWDHNERGLARADGFVITPKYAFYSVHSAFARFSSIELMEHWCFEQLWLRLRSKPPGKFLTKKLSITKQLFQSWAQCACTRTFQRTQRIPNYVFPWSMNSWFWALHQVGNRCFMMFPVWVAVCRTLSESVQAQGPPEKAPPQLYHAIFRPFMPCWHYVDTMLTLCWPVLPPLNTFWVQLHPSKVLPWTPVFSICFIITFMWKGHETRLAG